MSAPLAQQPKSPPWSVRRSARGIDAQAGAGDKRGGGSEVGDGASPLHPLGRKRGEERHHALRQPPGQDLTSDPVDALGPPSVLLRGGAERSPDHPPHASGHRAFGAPTQGADPWVGNSIKITS